MKSTGKILVAFLLNLFFSAFEFFGGIISGSVAILSDAVHDFGDAISIGLAFILEKVSHSKPNEKYTYGFKRYSILGGIITTVILVVGSLIVIYNAILRLINPTPINYDGVLIFAVVGLCVNILAVVFTHGGHSHNQKAVNLHLLEDVLGWAVVLVGAIVMKFTGFYLLDPILSIAVALFIIYKSLSSSKEILDLFLLKTPRKITVEKVRETVKATSKVREVRHIHIWSVDEQTVCATLCAVVSEINPDIKHQIKRALHSLGVACITVEIETDDEDCDETNCVSTTPNHHSHLHHHH